MLPSLFRPDLGPEVGGLAGAAHVPPPWFRPLVGAVRSARATNGPSATKGRTEAQRAGQRYEAKVQQFLAGLWTSSYRKSPWIFFIDGSNQGRRCQPDGILEYRKQAQIVLIEIKRVFNSDGYWQLEKLYKPVVSKWLEPERISSLLIVESFDPTAAFPIEYKRLEKISDLDSFDRSFKVLQWTP